MQPAQTEQQGGRSLRPFILLGALVLIALDQATKVLAVESLTPGTTTPVIDGVLHWTLQRNPGSAFGILSRFPIVFTILATGIAAGIVYASRRVFDRVTAIGLALVLGGAVGNLVDRLVRSPGNFGGHVVDFIDIRVWPIFNVADACITSGAVVLIIASWLSERHARDEGIVRADGAAPPDGTAPDERTP